MPLVIGLGVLVVAPRLVDNFWLRTLTQALMMACLAQGLNVIYGLGGYPALGNIVFFGVGAYAGALATVNLGVPALPSVLISAATAATLALVASRAMFGLRGSYFLMATVALNALMLEVVLVARGLTGGSQGHTVPAWVNGEPTEVYLFYYFAMLGAIIAASVVLLLIRRSKLGLGLLAIRGNESAAAVLGVPTMAYKTVAWTISAAIFGAIGSIYAHWIGYIDAPTVFNLTFSIEVFLIVLIGGHFLVVGPIIAALLFETADAIGSTTLSNTHLALLGFLIVVFVLYLPGGLPDLGRRVRGIVGRSPVRLGR
jgi:branched-chain amino acid transport system permease protein